MALLIAGDVVISVPKLTVVRPLSSPPDTWLNVVLGLGAIATVGGVVVGGLFAATYGRRASVSITAAAVETAQGLIVTARPIVKAVGIFPVKFHPDKGSVVRIQEASFDASGRLVAGGYRDHVGAFKEQFVEAGEELATTVMFPNPPVTPSTVGWYVYVKVGAPTRWNGFRRHASGWWTDQVFVQRPWNSKGVPS